MGYLFEVAGRAKAREARRPCDVGYSTWRDLPVLHCGRFQATTRIEEYDTEARSKWGRGGQVGSYVELVREAPLILYEVEIGRLDRFGNQMDAGVFAAPGGCLPDHFYFSPRDLDALLLPALRHGRGPCYVDLGEEIYCFDLQRVTSREDKDVASIMLAC